MVGALLGQRQADQPPPIAGHEVDRLRGHILRGQGQIALVLAVLVVHHDDHAPGANLLQCAGNIGEREFNGAYGIWHSDHLILAQRRS